MSVTSFLAHSLLGGGGHFGGNRGMLPPEGSAIVRHYAPGGQLPPEGTSINRHYPGMGGHGGFGLMLGQGFGNRMPQMTRMPNPNEHMTTTPVPDPLQQQFTIPGRPLGLPLNYGS